MNDLESKLSSILSSPESMEQIRSMARSLGLTPEEGPLGCCPDAPAPCDREPDLSSLLSACSSGTGGELPDGLDPRLLSLMTRLMKEMNRQDDEKTALLMALKPFLRRERQPKVEQAMRLSRMICMAKGLMAEQGGGFLV